MSRSIVDGVTLNFPVAGRLQREVFQRVAMPVEKVLWISKIFFKTYVLVEIVSNRQGMKRNFGRDRMGRREIE
ncbi:hypothetical protein [Burkholderia cepacia]|uniref:hypothetical protein n=1 Tax=Burkholderia cepacia TaxID=292 RepID=UPI001601F071|nr:hypothetical protein [Burkholderia cepacia]MBH9685259.1 hypothetical protein [Burkholderia cepacia]MBH9736304.1 hypothetical protein [Burkholderia cepacia]MBX3910060.1 hypothetical protein [Burkholderia cepacia]MBX4040294.1 hypothetical protein [Burkholderia cepacia]MBX4049126.1 hypothetical protein [Burkholderia cepacia]